MLKLQPGTYNYFVDIENKKIHFQYDQKSNSTELILFLHGLACSGESFRNLFDQSWFPSASLLVPDIIGFGQSSKLEDFSYTMEDQARVCEQLLENFSIIPFWFRNLLQFVPEAS